jgi:hypothetical protein
MELTNWRNCDLKSNVFGSSAYTGLRSHHSRWPINNCTCKHQEGLQSCNISVRISVHLSPLGLEILHGIFSTVQFLDDVRAPRAFFLRNTCNQPSSWKTAVSFNVGQCPLMQFSSDVNRLSPSASNESITLEYRRLIVLLVSKSKTLKQDSISPSANINYAQSAYDAVSLSCMKTQGHETLSHNKAVFYLYDDIIFTLHICGKWERSFNTG